VFLQQVLMSHPIGSRYVCDPPVMDTDRDTLILVRNLQKAEAVLLEEGWTPCLNGEYIEGFFKAFRKGVDNYVITEHEEFFRRYLIAAHVAKAFNFTDKADRIKAHEACVNASGGYMGLYDWDQPPLFAEIFL